ncbi:MAG: hypothetical protein WD468_04620 [Pirellulales bacterium]
MRLILFLAAVFASLVDTEGAYAQRDPRDMMEWEEELDRHEAQLPPERQQALREANDQFARWVLIIVGIIAAWFFFGMLFSSNKPDKYEPP